MRRDYPRFVSLLMASVALVLLLLSVLSLYRECVVCVPFGALEIGTCQLKNGRVALSWSEFPPGPYSISIAHYWEYFRISGVSRWEQMHDALLGFGYYEEKYPASRHRVVMFPLWVVWGAAGGVAWVAWRRQRAKRAVGFEVETKKS